MPEVESTADNPAGSKPAVVKKSSTKKKTAKRVKGVAVKNISDRVINTSIGSIPPGEEGRASVAETHSYSRYLEVLK